MLAELTGACIFAAGAYFGTLMLTGRLLPRRPLPKSYVPQRPTVGEKPEDERRAVDKLFVDPNFDADTYLRNGGRGAVPRVKNDPAGRPDTGSPKGFQA